MPFNHRKEILEAIKGVKKVVKVVDTDDTVCKTLTQVHPNIFVNGGDRFNHNIPEASICKKLKIKLKFKVGGKKVESSSRLVRMFMENGSGGTIL